MAKNDVGFKELDAKLDRVIDAILTEETVRKIVREESADLRKSVQDLVTGIDKLVKSFEELQIEYVSIKVQLSRHEKWFKQIAEITGLKLET